MKKIGIHQPNFIPWCGYFYKMINSDIFIFLDDVKYSKNNIINRNKLKGIDKPFWITIPVKKSSLDLINQVEISGNFWKKKISKTIKNLYSNTPFYGEYIDGLLRIINDDNNKLLIDLNVKIIKYFMKILKIEKELKFSSEFYSDLTGDDRLIELIKRYDGNIYISGTGGNNYQNMEKFKKEKIKILFSKFRYEPYKQKYGEFLSNLSTLDLIFNLGESSRKYIENCGRIEY